MALTQPTNSGTEVAIIRLTDVINPGATNVVDGVNADDKSVKWIVQVEDAVNTSIVTFELLALNKFGVSVDHVVYAKIGDFSIQFTIDVTIDNITSPAGGMNLEVTNNESHDIAVTATRIKVE